MTRNRLLFKVFLFFIMVNLCYLTFAKEKVLIEGEYPQWIELVMSTKGQPGVKIHFGEKEVLDKVTEDGKRYIIYSHDDEYYYKAVFDTCGNVRNNNGWKISDDNLYFISQYADEFPYERIYYKRFYYNDKNQLSNWHEGWYENTTENRLTKSSDNWNGDFIREYKYDGSYTETCTRVAENANSLYSCLGSIQFYDKDGHYMAIFTNNTNKMWRYFECSPQFENLVKDYNLDIDKSLEDYTCVNGTTYKIRKYNYYYETYSYPEGDAFRVFYLDNENSWDKPHYILKKFTDGCIYWYNEKGQITKGKSNTDEWTNTYQNDKLIYQKGKNSETFWDYDANGNVISKKRINSDKEWYIDEYKYDSKNRVVWEKTREVDKDEKVLSSITKELSYENDNSNFVTQVKWKTKSDTDWYSYVNGYKFTGIKGRVEYSFEKLSDTQLKVIPQDEKHWFVVELKD